MTWDLQSVANVVVLLGFAAALLAVVTMPARPGMFITPGIKLILGAAMFVWMFSGFSHVMQYGLGILSLDVYENYLKVLFVPFIACAGYLINANQQLRETERHAMVLSAEHEMLMRVVDTTPTGIVVLDHAGRIEFANERAKATLELREDADTGILRTPGWTCLDGPGCAPGTLSCCISAEPVRDRACAVAWPNGGTTHLSLNSTPIVAPDGSTVGSVVAITVDAAAEAALAISDLGA
jgi:hypothetical protein